MNDGLVLRQVGELAVIRVYLRIGVGGLGSRGTVNIPRLMMVLP